MEKKSSNWYVPLDIASFFIIPIIAILGGLLLPVIGQLKSGDVVAIFYAALLFGVGGTILLFFARLPLYRQRKFLSFGPSQLNGIHRKLYWFSYLLVAISILLLVLLCLRLR